MARSIIIVNATQVVTSDANPYGILSTMTGFPKIYDSGTSGDIETNMRNAKGAYFEQLSKNYLNTNPNRVLTTVTLSNVYGDTLLSESVGKLPDPEPEPEPTPEGEE